MKSSQIFISFSSKNQEQANHVCEFLEANGYRCFISSRDLVAGQEYAGQLIDNIATSTAVVLLLSRDSNESPHVLREIEYAVSKRIPIIVYTLENVPLSKSMEYYLMTHQWIPMGSDRDAKLLDGLQAIQNGSEVAFAKPRTEKTPKKRGKLLPVYALLLVGVILFVALLLHFRNNTPDGKERDTIVADAPTTESPEATGTKTEEPTTDGPATEAQTNEPGEIKLPKLGETVTFGTYLKEPIEWRVIAIDDEKVTLISSHLLSMKCFDAAEGGEYGYYDGVDYFLFENNKITDDSLAIIVRGNNDWSECNLRTWLNNSNEVVDYRDQAPCHLAVYKNPYDDQPGFLHEFTDEERYAIVPVINKTVANSQNSFAENGIIETIDLVYLLASDELHLLEEAGMNLYASPTDSCVATDDNPEGYRSYQANYRTDNYFWWLRDHDPNDIANMSYMVLTEIETGTQIYSDSVGANTYGVRPVINVNVEHFR